MVKPFQPHQTPSADTQILLFFFHKTLSKSRFNFNVRR